MYGNNELFPKIKELKEWTNCQVFSVYLQKTKISIHD